MKPTLTALLMLLLLVGGVAVTEGGSFNLVANCNSASGCEAGVPRSDPGQTVPPFAITHPIGYDRKGGVIEIPVCVASGDPSLVGPTQRAIATWNALTATPENCLGCVVWEEEGTTGPRHAESIILHELGHCALGLDHPNRKWDPAADGEFEETSYSRSTDAGYPGGIEAGEDGIPGSRDDIQNGPGGSIPIAKSVVWFRTADNDPFAIDGTVIQSGSYSRSVADLPPGSNWAANGNLKVAEHLQYANSQAAMYSRAAARMEYLGLSADEVNMIEMGMTGEDRLASTADDYTVELVFLEDCGADPDSIRISFGSVLGGGEGSVALCLSADIDYAFPPGNPFLARHFMLVEAVTGFAPFIKLNEQLLWDTGPVRLVFRDGFEAGDLSSWDSAVPALR